MIEIIKWIAVSGSLTGNYFINRKNILGLYIWIIANIIWLTVAIINKDYQQMILWIVYIAFNIDGIIKWSKK